MTPKQIEKLRKAYHAEHVYSIIRIQERKKMNTTIEDFCIYITFDMQYRSRIIKLYPSEIADNMVNSVLNFKESDSCLGFGFDGKFIRIVDNKFQVHHACGARKGNNGIEFSKNLGWITPEFDSTNMVLDSSRDGSLLIRVNNGIFEFQDKFNEKEDWVRLEPKSDYDPDLDGALMFEAILDE